MRVLVTGASGYVGSLITPRLLERGHDVHALVRSAGSAPPGTTEHVGDVVADEGLAEALAGVDVAYWLIHSMEGDADFDEEEAASAANFGIAARNAGLRRIVYLGGIQPADEGENSEHLASRETVEKILAAAIPESIAFRAGMIVGAGSRSFAFLHSLVQRSPVLPLPPWRERRTRPIGEDDLCRYLLAALQDDGDDLAGGLVLDIGGPDEVTYGELVERIRDAAGERAATMPIPVSATPVASRVAARIAGEDPGLVRPLMDSLQHDLIPDDAAARARYRITLTPLDAAIAAALDADG